MPSAVWKGQLSFGLVNIPVRLQRAARKERIPLHYVSRAPEPDYPADEDELAPSRPPVPEPESVHPESPAQVSRVRQSIETVEENRPVRRADLMRGYEVAPGQYVTLHPAELRQLRPPTSAAIEIVRTVRLAEIDPVFFETSYYVVPESAGERAYALLVTALRETEYVALATLAMHGREHVVVIRPGGKGLIAHLMYYLDEVHAESEYPANASLVNAKELELAKTFVEAIAGGFAPEEFKDAWRENVQKLIAAKRDRNEVAAAGAPVSAPKEKAPVTNIMDALRRSLELKRPAASEQQAAQPRKGVRKRRA